jgi:two-component system, NtrC family, sensor kinase
VRLTRKLTVALFMGILALLLVNAWFRVKREIALFESEAKRDHHVMARALSVSVAEVWRVEGEARALELVSRVNEAESHLSIRWVWPDAAPGSPMAPAISLERELATEFAVVDRVRSPGRVLTWMPVVVGGKKGGIELEESLANEREYVRATISRFAFATLNMAVVSGVIAMTVGILFVGRPVSRLIDQARRVGSGDLRTRIDMRQRDELGELAQEMNLMCDRLANANERVAAETAARIGTIEQLRHADRLTTVGKLASGIAHELGTPLNIVAGRAKMIATAPQAPSEIADNARIIADQAARITGIVQQLLDFARRRTPRKEPHDLHAIAMQTASLLGPMAQKQRVNLRLEGEPLLVDVDAGQVQQALANLVVNGVQAIGSGGTVILRTAKRRCRPPADIDVEERECGLIEVIDDGSGIEEETRAHLFEPFFTTKAVGQGTGLGLSVSWGIVREHGGWIDVETEPGTTTFRICLPMERRT